MKRLSACSLLAAAVVANAGQIQRSGIYPQRARFNEAGECGIGTVVPWVDRLWVVT